MLLFGHRVLQYIKLLQAYSSCKSAFQPCYMCCVHTAIALKNLNLHLKMSRRANQCILHIACLQCWPMAVCNTTSCTEQSSPHRYHLQCAAMTAAACLEQIADLIRWQMLFFWPSGWPASSQWLTLFIYTRCQCELASALTPVQNTVNHQGMGCGLLQSIHVFPKGKWAQQSDVHSDVDLFVEVNSTQFDCFHSLIVGFDLWMVRNIFVDLKVR